MPSPQYLIFFTIGGLAAANGTPQQVQAAFSPPLSAAYAMSGCALPTIKQHWNDIDRVQLMTYDGEANMDPRVCLALSKQAFMSWGVSGVDAAKKLVMGAELGSQYGGCNGLTTGWCYQNDKLVSMANDVAAKGYGGFFYWSNIDTAGSVTAYKQTYPIVRGSQPTSSSTTQTQTTTTTATTSSTTTPLPTTTTTTSSATTSTTSVVPTTTTSTATPTQSGICANPAQASTGRGLLIGYWHNCMF